MKNIILITLYCIILIIDKYNALPITETSKSNDTNNVKDINSYYNIYKYYSDIIDISGLAPKAYGLPSKDSGVALASWTESSMVNPEEMGEYFEGDILMPPVLLRNGLLNLSYRWPNAIIPYDFEGDFSDEDKILILSAMEQFHKSTCIRFLPYDDEEDYLAITNDGMGCSSAIGRLGGRQSINLAPACLKHGTIIHELMHTVGFLHEVSREDRDEYITVIQDNIQDDRLEDFKAYQSNTFDVPYDYGSIMHQSEYTFAKNPNKKTIEAKQRHDGVTLGQRNGLNSGDTEKINRMYLCGLI